MPARQPVLLSAMLTLAAAAAGEAVGVGARAAAASAALSMIESSRLMAKGSPKNNARIWFLGLVDLLCRSLDLR